MQLTIFDFENYSDPNKAKWINVQGVFKKCYVMAIPPKTLTRPTESKHKRNSKEFKSETEIWTAYVQAIYRTGIDWSEAIDLLVEHREQQKPIKMCIFEGFEPVNVIEYLEGDDK